MTTHTSHLSPEEVVRKFFDCYNDGRPQDFDEVVAPDCIDYGQTPPGRGPAGARTAYQAGVDQVGGLVRYSIDALVVDGDAVAATWTGTLPGGQTANGLSLYLTSGGLLRSTQHTAVGDRPAS